MDSQAVEIIGRSRLVEQLLLGGIEVASPLRDHGVDLIAYLDTGLDLKEFAACPIQMKAATGRSFSISAKYGKFPNLIHAFVWNVSSPEAEIYAMTQAEAVAVATELGYTETASWLAGDYYTNTKVSGKLLDLLQPYRMTAYLWREKVESAMRAVRTTL